MAAVELKDGVTLDAEIFRCNGKVTAVIGDPNKDTALRGSGANIPEALVNLALDAQAHPHLLMTHVCFAEREKTNANA